MRKMEATAERKEIRKPVRGTFEMVGVNVANQSSKDVKLDVGDQKSGQIGRGRERSTTVAKSLVKKHERSETRAPSQKNGFVNANFGVLDLKDKVCERRKSVETIDEIERKAGTTGRVDGQNVSA